MTNSEKRKKALADEKISRDLIIENLWKVLNDDEITQAQRLEACRLLADMLPNKDNRRISK